MKKTKTRTEQFTITTFFGKNGKHVTTWRSCRVIVAVNDTDGLALAFGKSQFPKVPRIGDRFILTTELEME